MISVSGNNLCQSWKKKMLSIHIHPHDSTVSSPSLISGIQWRKQLVNNTPPPTFKKNERTELLLSFLFSRGSDASSSEYLNLEIILKISKTNQMFYFLIRMSGKYPRKTLIAAITNEDNNFSPTIFIIDWSNYHLLYIKRNIATLRITFRFFLTIW